MHRKVDRRVNLLHALSARHAHPMCGWERAIRHKLRRECEGAEALQEAHDKVRRLIEREFLSQTLNRHVTCQSAYSSTAKGMMVVGNARHADRRRTAST